MKKNYVIDTNVLIDNPQCIEILRNGEENNIFIPYQVMMELDKLKSENRLSHIVPRVISVIDEQLKKGNVRIMERPEIDPTPDERILKEIESSDIDAPVLISNDKMFRLLARNSGIASEDFASSYPFLTESEEYTGFTEDPETPIKNSFFRDDTGKIFFFDSNLEQKPIVYQHKVWQTEPRNEYQNLAFELLLNDDINLVSIQGEAGHGKTHLSLAAAFFKVLEQKRYSKIFVSKPAIGIEDLGYLPGDINEKMEPYVKYMRDLAYKLHTVRKTKGCFINEDDHKRRDFNPDKLEVLPLSYIRGMNIDNAFVILDETQNVSRHILRTLLSRMGRNVKCVLLGDVKQVDAKHLNRKNNGLNWAVKKFKGDEIYAHMVLKGKYSRGPICDLIHRSNF